MPETEEEILSCMYEYTQAGFNGCIGSSDATHIIMEKCKARLKNHNLGAKDSLKQVLSFLHDFYFHQEL